MPLLKGGAANCTEDRPCHYRSPCPRCQAEAWLTPGDAAVLGFYHLVADQYINQTPMGVENGPPIITPRLEAYEAALRVYGYPEHTHADLVSGALLLHRLVHKQESVNWYDELGKPYSQIEPGDIADGYS